MVSISPFPCLRTESGNVSAEQDGPTLHMTSRQRPLSGMQAYVITFHTGHCNMSRHCSHGISSTLARRWAPLLEYKTSVNTDTYKEYTFSWKLIFLHDTPHINKYYTSIQVAYGYHQIYCQISFFNLNAWPYKQNTLEVSCFG